MTVTRRLIIKAHHITITLLIIITGIFASSANTQADHSQPVTLIEIGETSIRFYRVTPDGYRTPAVTLPNFRVSDEIDQEIWSIPGMEMLTTSADGLRIALVARRGTEIALFIHDAVRGELTRQPLSHIFSPEWSPDSRYLWLTPCCGEDATTIEHFIYDTEGETFTLINIFGVARWTPDSSGLVYYDLTGIYFISNDSSVQHPLMELEALNFPSETYICHLTWSDFHQRFYYAVGCSEGIEPPNERIYSVDLLGNNRLETRDNLASLLSLDQHFITLRGMMTSSEHEVIYFFIQSVDVVDTGDLTWYLARLNPDHTVTEVYKNNDNNVVYFRLDEINLSQSRSEN